MVNAACVRKIFVEKERNIFHENNCKAHPNIERIILIRAIKKRKLRLTMSVQLLGPFYTERKIVSLRA